MKKFVKQKVVTLRLSDYLLNEMDNIQDYLGLDRSDMLRLFIHNGLRFYKNKRDTELRSKAFIQDNLEYEQE